MKPKGYVEKIKKLIRRDMRILIEFMKTIDPKKKPTEMRGDLMNAKFFIKSILENIDNIAKYDSAQINDKLKKYLIEQGLNWGFDTAIDLKEDDDGGIFS